VRCPNREVASSRLLDWVRSHDESWLFVGLYIGMAVVLSVWLSLFWLVAMVAVHFGFELVRQRSLRGGQGGVVHYALWEVKLDIALTLLAFALTLYMDVVIGVLGLQSAARAGAAAARVGARAAGFERAIRGIVLSIDDLLQVGRAATMRRSRGGPTPIEAAGEAALDARLAAPQPGLSWGPGDRLSIGLAAGCVLLILLAPHVTDHSYGSAMGVLAAQMVPFPP
jgi:hypothetical protein